MANSKPVFEIEQANKMVRISPQLAKEFRIEAKRQKQTKDAVALAETITQETLKSLEIVSDPELDRIADSLEIIEE